MAAAAQSAVSCLTGADGAQTRGIRLHFRKRHQQKNQYCAQRGDGKDFFAGLRKQKWDGRTTSNSGVFTGLSDVVP